MQNVKVIYHLKVAKYSITLIVTCIYRPVQHVHTDITVINTIYISTKYVQFLENIQNNLKNINHVFFSVICLKLAIKSNR